MVTEERDSYLHAQICRADGTKWKLESRRCDSTTYDLNYTSLLSCEWLAQSHNWESLNRFVHKYSVQAETCKPKNKSTLQEMENMLPDALQVLASLNMWHLFTPSIPNNITLSLS